MKKMKKMACILMSALMLILLAAAGMAESASGLQTLVCQEEGFSVTCDVGFTSEYVASDGFTIYTRNFRNYPFISIHVDQSASRVTDGAEHITTNMRPTLEAYAKQYGAYAIAQYGEYQIAGRDVAAMSMQFTDEYGTWSHFLGAYDVHEDYTVYYCTRYLNQEDEQETIAALNQIAASLKLVDGTQISGQGSETQPSSQGSKLLNFAVTDITWNGMTAGRVAAPAGSTVNGSVSLGNSIEAPWLLNVTVQTPENYIMAYSSKQNYLDILRWDGGTGHQDGQYNASLHSTMLHYKNAAAYCDYVVTQMRGSLPTLVEEEDFSNAEAVFQRKESELMAKANELRSISGVGLDAVECSACIRVYAADVAGVPSYYCIFAGVEAAQSTAMVPGIRLDAVMQTISWNADFCYAMICPQASFETCAEIFIQFAENTGTSDQFNAANERLSTELMNIIASGPVSSGSDYSEKVLRSELSSGEDYTDRYSDYLFDQNDYTLSDGSHVKVSTEYDYVYQGENGNVYYTDSAFAQPGGSIQLYPNR